MVASVLVFADIEQPAERIARVLEGEGAVATTDGHITTFTARGDQAALVYPIALSAEERVGFDCLVTPDGNNVPDLTHVDAVVIECSSGDEVARLGRTLASALHVEVWFLDSVDQVWRAWSVDPQRVSLT
jgi:hypothetical protein